MHKQIPYINNALIAVFLVLIVITIWLTWQRIVVREEFRYFLTEEEVPDRLDFRTY